MSAQRWGAFEDVIIQNVSCASRFPPAGCLKQTLEGKNKSLSWCRSWSKSIPKHLRAAKEHLAVMFHCKETLFWMEKVSAPCSSPGKNGV